MTEQKKFWLFTLLVAVAVCVFYLTTMRHGVSWHSDHVIYLTDAANIAEGRPYGSGGPRYIARPDISKYLFSGPQAYPPIYPLLIAPVYKIFGGALFPMQVETTLFFALFIIMYALVVRGDLNPTLSTLAILVVGFNPYIWSFKEDVQSDLPFMFFCYLTLLVMCRKTGDAGESLHKRMAWGLALGFLIYVCYGLRTAGMTLVPAVILADMLKKGRLSRPTALSLTAAVAAIVLALAQGALLKSGNAAGNAYMNATSTGIAVKTIAYHIVHYPDELARQFFLTSMRSTTLVAGLLAFSVALFGFIKRLWRGPTPLETFFVVYAGLIIFFPYYGAPRLLLPIAPLFIFYLILGLKDLKPVKRINIAAPALVLFAIATLVPYALELSRIDPNATLRGPYAKETQELFEFVKKETSPEDVIIFVKPREMRFFTGRLSSSYHRPKDMEEQRKYIDDLGADMIVIDKFHKYNNYYNDYLPGFVAKYSDRATEVFKNDEFTVYRWANQPG